MGEDGNLLYRPLSFWRLSKNSHAGKPAELMRLQPHEKSVISEDVRLGNDRRKRPAP